MLGKCNTWIGSLISENGNLKIVKEMTAEDDKYKNYHQMHTANTKGYLW